MHIIMKMTYFVMLAVGLHLADGARVSLYPKHDIITKYKVEEWRPDGYSFEFETSSGSSRKERGYLKTDLTGKEQLVTEGVFSYVGDNNQVYKVSYVADENGYRPRVFQETTQQPISTSAEMERSEGGDFVFPEDNEYDFTTRKPYPPAVSSTTVPTFTEEYPFITTTIAEEEFLDNRVDLSAGLIGSLLGGK